MNDSVRAANSGSREPSRSSASRPIGFDPGRKEEHGPEMTRLLERFYGDPDPAKRVQNFSMTPGPKFHEASMEEIAAMINGALDDIESGEARPIDLDF